MYRELEILAKKIGHTLINKGWRLALAESCTGGLIAHMITQIPGSSHYFEHGIIVYSNQSKMEFLGVLESSLKTYGAVSREVAIEMATGLLKRAPVDITLAVTGIAGPDGGTPKKPVGTVWTAIATSMGVDSRLFNLHGERKKIKLDSALNSMKFLIEVINR